MKTLIYLLTISLLIISCEKNEVVKPEEKKSYTVRFVINWPIGKYVHYAAYSNGNDSTINDWKSRTDVTDKFFKTAQNDTSKWLTIPYKKIILYFQDANYPKWSLRSKTIEVFDNTTIFVNDLDTYK